MAGARGTTNYIVGFLFLVLAVTGLVFLFTFLNYLGNVNAGTAKVFPSAKSMYTIPYGQALDSQHVGLFGLTGILKGSNGDYMPVAALPLSFDDTKERFEKNLTYYKCLDPYFVAEFPVADRERMKQICMVERVKQVAFYMNDERSLTFSSAWNPFFMLMVVVWLYASWFLLFTTLPEGMLGSAKVWVYGVWQILMFVIVAISGVLQIDGTVIPRNNVLFSLFLIGFTVAQQLYVVKSSSDGGDWSFDLFENFAKNQRAVNVNAQMEMTDVAAYGRFRTMNTIIEMNVLLLPTFILSMYAISVNNVSEWMFQAVFVRYVLVVFSILLINYRKISPLYFEIFKDASTDENTMKRVGKEIGKYTGMYTSDVSLLVVSTLLLFVSSLTVDWWMFDGFQKNAITGWTNSLVYWLVVVLFLFALVEIAFMNNSGFTRNTMLMVLGVFLVILSYVAYGVLRGGYNKYFCSMDSPHAFYCGHPTATRNLNTPAYTYPVKITKTTFDEVYAEISGGLTFALA